VQQQAGEGLFRSEAVGGLVVVLAESGRPAEAARLLAEHPPDAVGVIPGMRLWAEAAVAAATGRATAAGELALAAARQTLAVGASLTALWYFADAARYGAAAAALAGLDALPAPPQSEIAQVRTAGIEARATGDGELLVTAAEQHLALGLYGHAAELAGLALARADRGAGGRSAGRSAARSARAAAALHEARRRLGLAEPASGAGTAGLTRRELEIARMAAQGMSDRDIAAALVVSIRTVESHLAAAYRKLGIGSRRGLATALAPLLPPQSGPP
jgi:DNA-binding NarL/FixJ family response regulator